jgi:pyruvate/2-oxoglutarate/acetoin dehydrogenase E1 component
MPNTPQAAEHCYARENTMREITYRQALQEALREEMQRDEAVFLLGEDIAEFGGSYKVTAGLLDEFGAERVRNTPISEAAIVGAALGAALVGMRPVAELMYVDFCAIAMDQIVNQVAKVRYMFGGKAKASLVIRTQGGAGRSSAAQHAQSLEAWFMHVPGLKIAQPSTPYDAKGLLKTAIRDDNPVMFLEHKLLYLVQGPVPEEEYLIPFGVADIKRAGTDVTVVATSRMVHRALAAAEQLAAEGIDAEVIDPRTLNPLDEDTILNSVRKTQRLVIAYEAYERGGVGAEIAALVAGKALDYLDAPIERVASFNTPMPFNPKLENYVVPTEERIMAGIKRVLGVAA